VPLVQPDVIHVGGILELRKIGAMAETYSVGIAAHNAAGPLSTAATLQAVAGMPNLQIQEMFAPQDAPWRDDLARPPIAVIDGKVQVPEGPGLGIELDEEVARAHPGKPRSLAFYSEGSILEMSYQSSVISHQSSTDGRDSTDHQRIGGQQETDN
jgi:galactonate dehydratase